MCYGTVVSGQCQANGYDSNGNLIYKTDARGILTTYAYDALNRITSRSYQNDSSGTPTVTYGYDSVTNGKGRLASVSSSLSSYSYSGYDAMGRALGGTETLGSQSYSVNNLAYDRAGHLLRETYPSGHMVTFAYDAAGRTNDFRGYLGDNSLRVYSTAISYDSASRWTREQFGTTTAPLYNKRHYNIRGQLYDVRLSSVNDEMDGNRGNIANYYNFQNFGFGTSGTDNNGNLLIQQHWIPDGNGGYTVHQQNYSYDSLNRISWVGEYLNGSQNTGAQSYSYDRFGNRSLSGSGTGTSNLQFSIDPNTNRYGVPGGQSGTMSYDPAGNLTFDSYSGQGPMIYDAENHMTQAWANNQWQYYSYDGNGHRVKRKVDGTETWQVYGLGGELIAEYAANASALTPQKEYGYRNGELLVTASSGQGCGAGYNGTKTWSATSGALGHVTGHAEGSDWAVYTGSDSANFMSYGPYDNTFGQGHHTARFTLMVDNTSGTDVVANLDVVTGFGGNVLATRQVHRNEFTAANQWQTFTLEFDNPCFGLLEARLYWYGSVNMKFHELSVTSTNSSGVDIEWLITDQLGTPRLIADQTGTLAGVKRHDYLPFGEELYAGISGRTTQQGYTGDSVRQKFTGYEADGETGLNFAQARYHSATQGRFTSVDPLRASMALANPQSFNRYTYVVNSPTNLTDPSGMVNSHGDSMYPWEEDHWGDIAWTTGEKEPEPDSCENSFASTGGAWTAPSTGVTEPPQNSGTILIIVGDPGLGRHNQGRNFDRVAETKQQELTAQGYNAIVKRASSIDDVENLLASNGMLDGVEYIGHASSGSLYVGEGPDPRTNIDLSNLSELSNAKLSKYAYIKINACWTGLGGWGTIAGSLANHLGRSVFAYNGPTVFSGSEQHATAGRFAPSKGPLYLIGDGATRLVEYRPYRP